MKKITAFIMVVLMCVSMFGMTVSAAGNPTITVSTETAAKGEEVTVTVSISNNPGIAMLELPISYDTTRLEKVEFTATGLPGGYVNTTGVWIGTSDSTYNGTILTLKFKVLDNAPAGDAAVNVSVRSAANWNEENVNFAVVNGKVTVTVPAHEHTYGDWTVTKEATCTEDGEKVHTCTVADCGYTETVVITKLGHKFGDWTVVKEATCTEVGVKARACATCKHTETQPIEKLDHKLGDWTVTKETTCTETGEKVRGCANCDYTETEVIAKTAHKMGSWTVTKNATCTADGSKVRKCADCGYTETEVIKATGHSMSVLKHDETGHWYVCSKCGAAGSKEAHSYENSGMCKCGYMNPAVNTGDANLDDVPKTGDITPMINLIMAAIVCVVCGGAFVLKRKFTK